MAVRRIIRMGHPTLRQVARPLDPRELGGNFVAQLVSDMIDTLHDYGGIGLAAPQINEPLRLAIIELPGGNSRYGEIPEIPLTVFVNPGIEILNPDPAGYWEGCLSVPGLRLARAAVQRHGAGRRSAAGMEREQERSLEGRASRPRPRDAGHLG